MHHLTVLLCGISPLLHSVNLIHCPPGSPHPARITSSQSPPSISSPITASTFHSRLKTHLFHKSFPPYIVTLIPSGLTSRILTCKLTELKGTALFVLVSGYVC